MTYVARFLRRCCRSSVVFPARESPCPCWPSAVAGLRHWWTAVAVAGLAPCWPACSRDLEEAEVAGDKERARRRATPVAGIREEWASTVAASGSGACTLGRSRRRTRKVVPVAAGGGAVGGWG